MSIYEVTLGVDRAAKDTRRRMTLKVPADDRLSAAIAAERIGDGMVRDPSVEYTHALSVNRKGLAVSCPEAVTAALSAADAPFTVDGELVGDRFHAFDLLESPAGDLRLSVYGERLTALESLLGRVSGTAFEVAPTVFGASAKKAFVDALRSAGKEGAVFKDLYATWTEGKMASGGPALKLKFWETCSCLVLRVNAGKRSVEVGLGDKGVGSVTIPPNYSVPSPGQVVEVRYLYVAGVGGSLYQPVYLGVRDDIDASECTADAQNLKYKAAA